MSRPVCVGIHETGELFDSKQEAVLELGLTPASLNNYLYGTPHPRTLCGLHLYVVKPLFVPVCRKCGVELTKHNWYYFSKRGGQHICKKCKCDDGAKEYRHRREYDWFGLKAHVFRGNYGPMKKEPLKILFDKQKGRCAICFSILDKTAHIDHIVPLSKGGKSEIDNLQFLCEMCNRGKYNWTQEEYIEHCREVAGDC